MIDPKGFNDIVKAYYQSHIKRVLKTDDYMTRPLTDHNKIMRQIMLGYFFRVLRLVLIIVTISFFTGTLWYLFCWQLYLDYYKATSQPSFIVTYMADN